MTTSRKRRAAAQPAAETAQEDRRFGALERSLGYTFRDEALLTLALTHRSYPYEERHGSPEVAPPYEPREHRNPPGVDNEQLEFVGDAVLGMAITEALYGEFPQCAEGELTRLRSSLVSRKRMAEMGEAIGLGEHLLLGRSAEQNGGRKKPALLANGAEALMAAVYLDARKAGADGLAAVREITERLLFQPDLPMLRAAVEASEGHGALRDHKTVLQERVQAGNLGRLRYIDAGQSGPAHQRRFAVEAHLETPEGTRFLAAAEGSSKKEAQQKAAALALETWSDAAATTQPQATAAAE